MKSKEYKDFTKGYFELNKKMIALNEQAEDEIKAKLLKTLALPITMNMERDGQKSTLFCADCDVIVSQFGKYVRLYFVNVDIDSMKLPKDLDKIRKDYIKGKINASTLESLTHTGDDSSACDDENNPTNAPILPILAESVQCKMDDETLCEFLDATEISIVANGENFAFEAKP